MTIKNLTYKKLGNLTKQKFNDESLVVEIGIDSLDLVELVTDVEDEMNLSITDDELISIKTVGDIIKVFNKMENS
ncbi:MAG: acyl carrier protein [Mycoplasmataceae bacterium]|nr:acyl carrier protein [Mycoplasmataceae bacterium]